MKVNFCDEAINGVKIGTLGVGKTFCDHRRSNPDQVALYMIVDDKNAYVNQNKLFSCSNIQRMTLAINIATGQLKGYTYGTLVIPVDAEVKVPKF